MKYIKTFENKDIDPFQEEDWEEDKVKEFFDEKTGLVLKYDERKKKNPLEGWSCPNLWVNKFINYVKEKHYNQNIEDEAILKMLMGYEIGLLISKYKKQI